VLRWPHRHPRTPRTRTHRSLSHTHLFICCFLSSVYPSVRVT
jgi:hypothetical protein